jgi:ribonuclease BN (tRNA processing enzyme)
LAACRVIACLVNYSVIIASLLLAFSPVQAQGPAASEATIPAAKSLFITLGTMAGPIPSPQRSQPANLLQSGSETILVDIGDGALQQVAKAGVGVNAITAVVISHIHFDHTGGLFALLGTRQQVRLPKVLTIYGPPATARMVEGLIAALQPAYDIGAGLDVLSGGSSADAIKVIELRDGDTAEIGNIKLTAAANSHFASPQSDGITPENQSLSFRFELPDRTIVYTGDTGPSEKVLELAKGADILFAEVIDPEFAIGTLRRMNPAMPEAAVEKLRWHFTDQHLVPEEVGLLANQAGAKSLVLTHNALGAQDTSVTLELIRKHFSGPVTIADDLDRF